MSRQADLELLEYLNRWTEGKLHGAVHNAGHDFALGTGVRYTADMADTNDLGTIYRVRAWFGERLLFDSGEPGTTYGRIEWALPTDTPMGQEWLWDPAWQRVCDDPLPPEDVPDICGNQYSAH
jgi:hypothetical protein